MLGSPKDNVLVHFSFSFTPIISHRLSRNLTFPSMLMILVCATSPAIWSGWMRLLMMTSGNSTLGFKAWNFPWTLRKPIPYLFVPSRNITLSKIKIRFCNWKCTIMSHDFQIGIPRVTSRANMLLLFQNRNFHTSGDNITPLFYRKTLVNTEKTYAWLLYYHNTTLYCKNKIWFHCAFKACLKKLVLFKKGMTLRKKGTFLPRNIIGR